MVVKYSIKILQVRNITSTNVHISVHACQQAEAIMSELYSINENNLLEKMTP